MTDSRQANQLAQIKTAMTEKRGRTWAFPTITGERTTLIGCEVSRLGLALAPRLRSSIPRIDWLARTLRASGGSAIWSHFAPNAFDGPAGEILGEADLATLRQRLGEKSWTEVNEGIQDGDGDQLFSHAGYSALTPELLAALKKAKTDTVLIAGAETDGTIESTARAAATEGLRVIVIGDCCISSDETAHIGALTALHRRIADVRPVDEVVAELRRNMAS